MKLTGNHVLDATRANVWEKLMDPETLARIVPGISKLERVSDHSFKSLLSIKIGPLGGSFTGTLQLENIVEEKGFTLNAQQNSKIGNANAAVNINLTTVNEKQTEVAFDGDVKLSGMLATMGQRVIGGVANTLTKEFFNNLEKELGAKESPVS